MLVSGLARFGNLTELKKDRYDILDHDEKYSVEMAVNDRASGAKTGPNWCWIAATLKISLCRCRAALVIEQALMWVFWNDHVIPHYGFNSG